MKNLSHYPFKSTISKCPSSQPCPTNLAVQRSNPSQTFSSPAAPPFQTTYPARFPNDGECPRHHGFVICRLARWKEPVNLCVRDFLQPAAGVGCLRGIGLILGIPRVLHVTGRPLVNGMQNTIRYWTSLHVIGGRKKLREWNRKLVCARTGVRALHSMNKPAGFTGLQKHRSLDRTPKKKMTPDTWAISSGWKPEDCVEFAAIFLHTAFECEMRGPNSCVRSVFYAADLEWPLWSELFTLGKQDFQPRRKQHKCGCRFSRDCQIRNEYRTSDKHCLQIRLNRVKVSQKCGVKVWSEAWSH